MPRSKKYPPDLKPSPRLDAGAVPSTQAPQDRSVLLVEDDVDNRESIADALRADGFRVYSLATAAQALKMLDDPRCPSLILLDLWMPGMGGRELLAAVALRPDRARFRVIVMSAAPGAEALAGRPCVVHVLRKPFALDTLLAQARSHA